MSSPVEEIKERLNIVELIQEYVPLKKAGLNHKACCPFHNEKTPSFTVSESKQFFHCFGCGKGGDVFTFIEAIEGVEFPEALRMLAQKAHVELQSFSPKEQNERTRLLDCLQLAAQFYHAALRTSPAGERGRAYIQERGITAESIQDFQIGYSPESWDALIQFLRQKQYTNEEIEKAGLSIRSPKTGGWYDRFRGRVMFPIYNAHGNVIGFGGRTLDPHQKEAKYINSPQTSVYNKSAVLYGLHIAKRHIQQVDATVIVEGYMDVITAHQAKFRNVVAASGTALTTDQVRLLKRYSGNVILAFDGDAAGLKAAWRGMQVAITEGMNIKVLTLPQGEDPDDLIRRAPEEFRQRAAQAQLFMDYAFQSILSGLDLSRVDHKKKAAAELLPMIALFPDTIEQTHYIQLLAQQLGVESEILQRKLTQLRSPFSSSAGSRASAAARVTSSISPQPTALKPPQRIDTIRQRLFALITCDHHFFKSLTQYGHAEEILDSRFLALYKALESFYNPSEGFEARDIHFVDADLSAFWNELSMIGEQFYPHASHTYEREFTHMVRDLHKDVIKHRLHVLERTLANAETHHDAAAIAQLSEELQQLTNAIRTLG